MLGLIQAVACLPWGVRPFWPPRCFFSSLSSHPHRRCRFASPRSPWRFTLPMTHSSMLSERRRHPHKRASLSPDGSRHWWIRCIASSLPQASGSASCLLKKLHLPSPNIAGRSGRDALALAVPQTPGTIDVFVVASVGDVDDPRKEVAGVHWRYLGLSKGNRGRRYIILSANAADSDTLAHELGHWFGLVHVKDPANLMCPGGKRNGQALTRAQVRTISSTCQKSFQTGELKDLPAAAPAHP